MDIADIIEIEMERHGAGETYAEKLRWAAWLVREEHPGTTSSQFGDAARESGLHRQGAMNRWNEAMKNWEHAFG